MLHPATDIADIFHAVQSGAATYGVVPFENSSNGAVVPTWDLLASSSFPDVLVCAEAYVAVRHALLGRRCPAQNKAASGTPCLAHVKTIYSHPQAWGQCVDFLTGTPGVRAARRVDASSTSAAARIAAADGEGKSAAVASKEAAKLWGLDVLVEDVSDVEGNATRFLVLRRGGVPVADVPVGAGAERYGTLLRFVAGEPAVVTAALGALARRGVGVVNVGTRPGGGKGWERAFFVEIVLGGSEAVEAALMDLGDVVPGWRWLGSWESKLAA